MPPQTPTPNEPTVLFSGKHLQLLSRDGWEFADRVSATGVVVVVAVNSEGKLLLTEQFRPPVDRRVVDLPAGLAGDISGAEGEAFEFAAKRELLEETGYEATEIEFLGAGPSSAGLTSEILTFYSATNVHRRHAGGGDSSEEIEVCEVPLNEVDAWLQRRGRDGRLIDPKIYAGLYLAEMRGRTL